MRTACRDLAFDDDDAIALVVAAGAHGVYVHNALAAHEGQGLWREGRDAGLAWAGPRGNLVLVTGCEPTAAIAEQWVAAILDARWTWRIAMGPAAIVDRLRERLPVRALACRDQVYYRGDAATAAPRSGAVRSAGPADRNALIQASLQLNHADLNVDPARVDRRWLRDAIDERIAAGATRVIGEPGVVRCKLDLGSVGPGGTVIEGVFTFPQFRGQGMATDLVATVLHEIRGPAILHVGKHNRPARAAYERAGMHEAGGCRLLLLP